VPTLRRLPEGRGGGAPTERASNEKGAAMKTGRRSDAVKIAAVCRVRSTITIESGGAGGVGGLGAPRRQRRSD